MAEDFVTICAVCTKGITKQDLKYANGHSFHNECFTKQGKEFPVIDSALQSNTSRAKIDLIQLKNLKERLVGDSKTARKSTAKRRTTRKKTATRKTARKSTAKRRTTRKKTATRKTARKSTAKRRTRR